MDNSEFVCVRLLDGCSILYQKSLIACIAPQESCLCRRCQILRFNWFVLFLNVCLYTSVFLSFTEYFTEYLSTLDEMEGLI